jgi:hypothetical protein
VGTRIRMAKGAIDMRVKFPNRGQLRQQRAPAGPPRRPQDDAELHVDIFARKE